MPSGEFLLLLPFFCIIATYNVVKYGCIYRSNKLKTGDCTYYRTQNSIDKMHLCRVKSNSQANRNTGKCTIDEMEEVQSKIIKQVIESKEEISNIHIQDKVIAQETVPIILNVIRQMILQYGNKLDDREVRSFEERTNTSNQMHKENCNATTITDIKSNSSMEIDASFYRHIEIISDYALSESMQCAPWNSGDDIYAEYIPAVLRYVISQTQTAFSKLGELRHVYIEYSPHGLFYHHPSATRQYDGFDYVVIPIRRDECDSVITISPIDRSKHSSLFEVMKESWTNFDIDALLSNGSMMRVFGKTRENYGWGVRPGHVWFGQQDNVIDVEHRHDKCEEAKEKASLSEKECLTNSEENFNGNNTISKMNKHYLWYRERYSANNVVQWSNIKECVCDEMQNLLKLPSQIAMRLGNAQPKEFAKYHVETTKRYETPKLLDCTCNTKPITSTINDKDTQILDKLEQHNTDALFLTPPEHDAAIIVLHFEGPVSKRKERQRLLYPESLLFGKKPVESDFATWKINDDWSKEGLKERGLFDFVWTNGFRIINSVRE